MPKWVFRGSFGVLTSDNSGAGGFEEYSGVFNILQPTGDPRPVFFLKDGPGPIQYKVNPDGTVKPGMANSPCLATVPISSMYIDQNGGGATLTATEIAYLKSTGTYMRPAVAATAVYVPFRKYTAAARVPSLVVCAVVLLSYHASPPWVSLI